MHFNSTSTGGQPYTHENNDDNEERKMRLCNGTKEIQSKVKKGEVSVGSDRFSAISTELTDNTLILSDQFTTYILNLLTELLVTICTGNYRTFRRCGLSIE